MASRYRQFRARALKAMFKAHAADLRASAAGASAPGPAYPRLLLVRHRPQVGQGSTRHRSCIFSDADRLRRGGLRRRRAPRSRNGGRTSRSIRSVLGPRRAASKLEVRGHPGRRSPTASGSGRRGKTVNPMWAKYQARTEA